MAFDCSCGSSFILSGHLWVVIAENSGPPERVVIVYLTSLKPGSDTTVVLHVGDHKFIKHDTVISYDAARIALKAEIMRRVAQRDFQPDVSFAAPVLEMIQEGLFSSPFTPRDIKHFCKVALSRDGSDSGCTTPPTSN